MPQLAGKIFQDPDDYIAVLETLLEFTHDSILITDATEDPKILYANPAFAALTGYEPTEVLGKSPRLLQGTDTDRNEIARLKVAIQAGGWFEGNAINYKKDGTAFMMCWSVEPIKIQGRIKYWMAVQYQGHNLWDE